LRQDLLQFSLNTGIVNVLDRNLNVALVGITYGECWLRVTINYSKK
jgi:hypothetical protein